MKEIKDPKILQDEAWKDIIQTPGWKYFLELIRDHVQFLNKQTCMDIRNGNTEGAVKSQAKAEDWEKIMKLVTDRVNEIGKAGEE